MSHSDEPTTTTLLESFHTGDRSVLGAILERQRPWLWAFVRRNMGDHLRALESSEDLVQETLRSLLESGPAFVPQDDVQFRKLVGTIVLNRLRDRHDYARAQRRDAPESPIEPAAVSRLGAFADSRESPSREAERSEEAQLVQLALEILDPDDAWILRRHRWEGVDLGEIASDLGLTRAAAQKRHVRAVAKLGEWMRRLTTGDLDELGEDPASS